MSLVLRRKCCCNDCENASFCESSPVRKLTCTGRRITRTDVSLAASFAGWATVRMPNVSTPEDQYTHDAAGEFTMDMSLERMARNASVGVTPGLSLNSSITGIFRKQVTPYNHLDWEGEFSGGGGGPGYIPPEYNTLSPFGEITVTASGSSTIRDLHGSGGFDGEGEPQTWRVDYYIGSLAARIEVNATTGAVTAFVQVAVTVHVSIANPMWDQDGDGEDTYNNRRHGYYISFSGSYQYTGSSAPGAVCIPTPVNPTTMAVGDRSVSTGLSDGSVYDPIDVDWDATVETVDMTAQHRTDDIAGDDDPSTGQGCARAYSVAATGRADTNVAADPDVPIYATITGRVVMPTVFECGSYPTTWTGFGRRAFTDRFGNPFDEAVRFTLSTGLLGIHETSGGSYALGKFTVTRQVTLVGFTGSPTGGTFRFHFGASSSGPFPWSTAPIPYTASGATVRTAIEAIPELAGWAIGVRKRTSGGGATTANPVFEITYAGPGAVNAYFFAVSEAFTPGTAGIANTPQAVSTLHDWAFKSIDRCASGSLELTHGSENDGGEAVTMTPTATIPGDPTWFCG